MGNFLLGFGIGVTIGVLFAPKPGSETRQYIADKTSEGTDFLVQQSQQIKDTATDLLERGKQTVASQKEKVGSMFEGMSSQREQFQRS